MRIEDLITVKAAAAQTRVCEATIRSAIRFGAMESVNVCGHVFITPEELDRWLHSDRKYKLPHAGGCAKRSIVFGEDQYRKAQEMAKRERCSTAAIIREALDGMLAEEER